MKADARDILRYAKLAANELNETDFENSDKWLLRWITVVALLRAVLAIHIKQNKALNNDSEYKEYWGQLKKDDIFKNFIEAERNLALKEFDFERIKSQVNFYVDENGNRYVDEAGNYYINSTILLKSFNKPVQQLLSEALVWIEKYLNNVEERFLKKAVAVMG